MRATPTDAGSRRSVGALVTGLVALVCTTLVVAPWLGRGNEAFVVGKAVTLAVAAACASATVAGVCSARLTLADLLLALFFVHGLASAAVNGVPLSTSSITLLPELSAGLVMAGVAVGTRGSPTRRAFVLDVVIVSCSVMAGIALFEALGFAVPWSGARRPFSTLGNRNFVGAEAAIATVLASGRLLRRRSWWRWVSLCVLVTTVGVSRCRSAWVGLLVAAFAVGVARIWLARSATARTWPVRASGKRLAASAGVLGIALAALVPWPGLHWTDAGNPLLNTFGRLAQHDTGTGRERLDDFGLAARIALEQPFFGVGPRRWDDAASARAHEIPNRHATPQHFWASPSSDVARFAGEGGVVGIAVLLAALVAFARASLRALASRASVENLALLGALAVLAINASLDVPLFRPSSLALTGTLLGLARAPESGVLLGARPVKGLAIAAAAVVLAGTSLRALAGATLAVDPHSVAMMRQAQALFWRPDVAEELSLQLSRDGRCDESEAVGYTALAASPHHWGIPQALAACFEAQGDAIRSRHFAEQRDLIEPHLQALFAEPRALYSGRFPSR